MAALSAERDTREQVGNVYGYPLAAGVKAWKGGIAVLDAAGDMKPGVTATGLVAVGRFEDTHDVAGENVTAKGGDFWYANSAAVDEITAAEIGDDCYIVDDQTVAKTNGGNTRSVAGKIIDVDAHAGVLVRLGL